MGHEDIDAPKGYICNYNEIEKNRAYMDKVAIRVRKRMLHTCF